MPKTGPKQKMTARVIFSKKHEKYWRAAELNPIAIYEGFRNISQLRAKMYEKSNSELQWRAAPWHQALSARKVNPN
jgi:hypothetical protein